MDLAPASPVYLTQKKVEAWHMAGMVDLPLFPLHTVLFPRMLVPLHVFEGRYKAMLEYCLEHEQRFGIALIRSGEEVGEPAEPHDIGTTAQILRLIELEDDRKYVLVRGMERFAIRNLDRSRPYLMAQVEIFPLDDQGMDPRILASVEMEFYRYLRLLKQAQGITVSIMNLPEDPEGIAWMIAWGLQLDMALRQELLSPPGLQELLLRERELIRSESVALQVLAAAETMRRRPPEEYGTLSLN